MKKNSKWDISTRICDVPALKVAEIVGKPFRSESGERIGVITEAKKINNGADIQVKVKLNKQASELFKNHGQVSLDCGKWLNTKVDN